MCGEERGNDTSADCCSSKNQTLAFKKHEESPAVLHWVWSWGSCGFGRVQDGLQREPELHNVIQAGGGGGDFTVVAAR